METQATPRWRIGDEILTPGMLQLFYGNTDAGCLEKPHADSIVKRLNDHDALVEALLAARKARLATDDWQRECVKQAHGFERDRCGECFLCLERKALASFTKEV